MRAPQQFAAVTERLFGFPQSDPRNQFAIVLDGRGHLGTHAPRR